MKHFLLFILCVAGFGLAAQPGTEEIKKLKYNNVKFYLGQKKILHNVLMYDAWAVGKLDISTAVADSLADFMLVKKNIIIEIGGHSNCTGMQDPMSASLNAAAYIKNYLAGKGVPADRIEIHGYGYALPLVPCVDTNNPTGDTYANRRIEAKITGFVKPIFTYTDSSFYSGQVMTTHSLFNYEMDGNGNKDGINQPVADTLANFLLNNSKMVLEIGVHTDTRGTDADNKILSVKKANAVIDYLKSKGIEASRLKAEGYGESMPVVPCAQKAECGEDIHSKNRRVELKILSVE